MDELSIYQKQETVSIGNILDMLLILLVSKVIIINIAVNKSKKRIKNKFELNCYKSIAFCCLISRAAGMLN